jgi:putative DNA primase/helicase
MIDYLPTIKTNQSETTGLLKVLARGGHGYYWTLPGKLTTWWTGNPPAIPQKEAVYFGVNPCQVKKKENQRAKIEDIAGVNCIYAEFDGPKNPGDPTKTEQLERIQSLPQPSVLIDSGGGWHCYWILPELFTDITRADSIQKRWVEYTQSDNGAKDLARVLRVPDTLNNKYKPPRPVIILYSNLDRTYTIDELESYLPILPPPKPKQEYKPGGNGNGGNGGDPGTYWLKKYLSLAAPGNRNDTGYKLAQQLYYSRVPNPESIMREYARRVPGEGYTEQEALTSLREALKSQAREPAILGGTNKPMTKKSAPEAPTNAINDNGKEDLQETPRYMPLETVMKSLQEGESGDADLLTAIYSNSLLYDHSTGEWYGWNKNHWKPDKSRKVYKLVSSRLPSEYLHAAAEVQNDSNDKLAKELISRAGMLRARRRIDNVLFLAAGQLGIEGTEWDSNPWLLAVDNGVIDLRSGKLIQGNPHDYIRARCPTSWKGLDTPAPIWKQVLIDIFNGDNDLISYLQRMLGFAITGMTTEHILPIFWGSGRNGKTTLLETLGAVLGGDIATSSQADAIMDVSKSGGGPQPFIYALRGKRVVWASESNEGRRLNVGLVKLLTGGDRLNVRTLHSKPVEFLPTHTLILLTNHKPHIPADDIAAWDRIALIPFSMRFIDNPKADNERKADQTLREKLQGEASGILAWLVRGCLEWQRIGLGSPEQVKIATEAYKSEEDTLGIFIAECCVINSIAQVKSGDLYKRYKDWAKEGGLQAMTMTAFGKRIQKLYTRKVSNGVYYLGIGLLENAD